MSKAAKVTLVVLVLVVLYAAGFIMHSARLATVSDHASQKLIVFHAGSLAVPFKQICEEFERRHPGVKVIREIAGSRECARKITDLHKACDILASADYAVIDTLLIPEHADWNIRFAGNEMVIAFREDSRDSGRIAMDNWYDILRRDDVTFGRSDPNADPCGYRTVLAAKLAEKLYDIPGLADEILAKDRKYIRPMAADLLALLEVGELDYVFAYRSVAQQHGLKFITLPDKINFKKAELADFYKNASIRLTGKQRGTFITYIGEPIIYGVTIPKDAPNGELAAVFLAFLLDPNQGGTILEQNGQTLAVPSPTDTFEKLPESLKVFALPMSREGEG